MFYAIRSWLIRPTHSAFPRSVELLESRTLLSAYTYSNVAAFGSSFGYPAGQPVMDSGGNVYGVLLGSTADGIYEVAKGGSTPTVLATFPANTIVFSASDLSIDGNGNLYGIADYNAEAGSTGPEQGVIFELPKGASTVETVASLGTDEVEDGSQGGGKLLVDSAGDIFGADRNGGANGVGYIFEILAGTTSITTLASFAKLTPNGLSQVSPAPNLTLTMDSSGNLFGTTNGAGNSIGAGDGSVFELPAGTSTINTLATFDAGTGIYPQSGVVFDAAGDMFGSVLDITDGSLPGIGQIGSIFEIPAGSTSLETRATFTAATGYADAYPLTIDSAGDIFGATQYGGPTATNTSNGNGVDFELPAGSNTLQTLHTFGPTGNSAPTGGLLLDPSTGNLYGTVGGVNNAPAEVYELSQGGSSGGGGTPSLSGALSGTLPATSVIASQKTNITQKLVLTDSGSAALKGSAPVTYYLSNGQSVDGNSIALPGGITAHLNLKAGKHATFNFHLKTVPASTPNGSYYLVAQVAASTGTIDVASAATIAVAPAQIDLTGSYVKVSPSVKSGKKLTLTITVSNEGNVPAIGSLPVQIDLSTDNGDDQNLDLPQSASHIDIKPGKTARLTLHDVVTAADGSYYLFIKLDPANTFSDVNLSNNDFQSPTAALTVTG